MNEETRRRRQAAVKRIEPHGDGITLDLPGTVPGQVAERNWRVRVRLRLLVTNGQHPLSTAPPPPPAGTVMKMERWGRAGEPVQFDTWFSNRDVEVALGMESGDVEVLEVLEHWPATWEAAALSAEDVVPLLEPHHPGAAEAVAVWLSAGLHVAHESSGLVLRTPAPELRRIGVLETDYYGQHTKPYLAVIRDDPDFFRRRTRSLSTLPLNPLLAADPALQ